MSGKKILTCQIDLCLTFEIEDPPPSSSFSAGISCNGSGNVGVGLSFDEGVEVPVVRVSVDKPKVRVRMKTASNVPSVPAPTPPLPSEVELCGFAPNPSQPEPEHIIQPPVTPCDTRAEAVAVVSVCEKQEHTLESENLVGVESVPVPPLQAPVPPSQAPVPPLPIITPQVDVQVQSPQTNQIPRDGVGQKAPDAPCSLQPERPPVSLELLVATPASPPTGAANPINSSMANTHCLSPDKWEGSALSPPICDSITTPCFPAVSPPLPNKTPPTIDTEKYEAAFPPGPIPGHNSPTRTELVFPPIATPSAAPPPTHFSSQQIYTQMPEEQFPLQPVSALQPPFVPQEQQCVPTPQAIPNPPQNFEQYSNPIDQQPSFTYQTVIMPQDIPYQTVVYGNTPHPPPFPPPPHMVPQLIPQPPPLTQTASAALKRVNVYFWGRRGCGKSTLLNLLCRKFTHAKEDLYLKKHSSPANTVAVRAVSLSMPRFGIQLRMCDTPSQPFTAQTIQEDLALIKLLRRGLKLNTPIPNGELPSFPVNPDYEAHAFAIVLRADELKWISYPKYKSPALDTNDLKFLAGLRGEAKSLDFPEPALIITCCDKDKAHTREQLHQLVKNLGFSTTLILTGVTDSSGKQEFDTSSVPFVDAMVKWLTQGVASAARQPQQFVPQPNHPYPHFYRYSTPPYQTNPVQYEPQAQYIPQPTYYQEPPQPPHPYQPAPPPSYPSAPHRN
ncbi:hypothetical protein Pelo_4735 [Pelomyxa schiedti]|nr:hypothetical protein Pelo_4735 [Pelomyxa schiedti]